MMKKILNFFKKTEKKIWTNEEIDDLQLDNIREIMYPKKLPSETFDRYWLGCKKHSSYENDYPKDTIDGGKWLIFVSKDKVDKLWGKIRLETILGYLGHKSKVSTAKPNPNSSSKSFVICIYTHDSNNKKDVMKIRKKLKRLGVRQKIGYKTNKTTLEGKYANKGFKNISKYQS